MPTYSKSKVGIDDMALYIPSFKLPIEVLAEKRGIEAGKLKIGLGLENMAVPAPNEDAATMAAEAIFELFEKNELDPTTIGRIYMGTESAVDGAKPTATYAVQMVEEALGQPRAFKHCDVVDLTFACIGAVDALQNSLDWVRCNPGKQAIVVASDKAKYELKSGGEYTQGAGAIAILIKENPRLLSFGQKWGVSTESVHDFFKPRRAYPSSLFSGTEEALPFPDATIDIFRETPVFDGQFSNKCFTNRVIEAMQHFSTQLSEKAQNRDIFKRWAYLAFHLPYAAHGRRIAADLFALESERIGTLTEFCKENEIEKISADADPKTKAVFMKALSKSHGYRAFVQQKLAFAQAASSEVGNMYTASIFLGLMGILDAAYHKEAKAAKNKIGFFAYGSGSKAKVFEATVQKKWKEVASRFDLKGKFAARTKLDFDTYEAWHKGQSTETQASDTSRFLLKNISTGADGALVGTRTYECGV